MCWLILVLVGFNVASLMVQTEAACLRFEASNLRAALKMHSGEKSNKCNILILVGWLIVPTGHILILVPHNVGWLMVQTDAAWMVPALPLEWERTSEGPTEKPLNKYFDVGLWKRGRVGGQGDNARCSH